jgi:hypothetical protein
VAIQLAATRAGALPLAPFRYEDQAQRHCLTIPSSGSISGRANIIRGPEALRSRLERQLCLPGGSARQFRSRSADRLALMPRLSIK